MRVLILVCVLAAGAPLGAITVVPLRFSQLVTESTTIVHGHVSDVHGQWTADRRGIESLVTVDVTAYLKGGLGPQVTVRVPGGRAGGFVNVVPGAPQFREGDAVILFLKSNGPSIPVVTGTTQGVYRVAYDARTGGPVVIPPLVESGPARLLRGDPARRPLSMTAFRAAVADVQEGR